MKLELNYASWNLMADDLIHAIPYSQLFLQEKSYQLFLLLKSLYSISKALGSGKKTSETPAYLGLCQSSVIELF